MLSHRQAKNELQEYFYDGWKDGLTNGLPDSTPALSPLSFTDVDGAYTPAIFWRNTEVRSRILPDQHFARFVFENLRTSQTSMPGGRANGSGVKYTTPGIAVVQLFFSKNNTSTAEEDFLTAIAHEMFLGTSSDNVWFRDATIKGLPEEEKNYRTDVVVEYEYDTHIRVP